MPETGEFGGSKPVKKEEPVQQALRILGIPSSINVKLVKSKRVAPYATLVSYRQSQDGESNLEYVIEYRKNMKPELLRHELCHLKLHLMGLPVVEVDVGSPPSLRSQVLSTLHEDYYASLIMHQKFTKDFLSSIMRDTGSGDHGIHLHDEVNDDLLSWLLQRYVLKIAVLEALGYKNEAETNREEIEHLKEESHLQLYLYLNAICEYLSRLPPLDPSLRKFTAEEKDCIGKIVGAINDVEISL